MDETRVAKIRAETDDERAALAKIDAALTDRTPFTRGKIRFALNNLSDVEMLIRWEAEAQPQWAGIWLGTAESNVAIARSIRQQVQKLLEPVGGDASQLVEFPR